MPKRKLYRIGLTVAHLVEALRYKSKVAGSYPMGSVGFFIDIILPVALLPWGRINL